MSNIIGVHQFLGQGGHKKADLAKKREERVFKGGIDTLTHTMT